MHVLRLFVFLGSWGPLLGMRDRAGHSGISRDISGQAGDMADGQAGGEDTLCIRYPYPSMPFNRATVLLPFPAK